MATVTAPSSAVDQLPQGRITAVRGILGAAGAAVLGLAPHVLHHVGPLAGAAIVAGATGTLIFGLLGFVLAIPMLRRVHRRTGSWRAPVALLATMALVFSVSAFVIGPAINSSDDDSSATPTTITVPSAPPGVSEAEHESHHGG